MRGSSSREEGCFWDRCGNMEGRNMCTAGRCYGLCRNLRQSEAAVGLGGVDT